METAKHALFVVITELSTYHVPSLFNFEIRGAPLNLCYDINLTIRLFFARLSNSRLNKKSRYKYDPEAVLKVNAGMDP